LGWVAEGFVPPFFTGFSWHLCMFSRFIGTSGKEVKCTIKKHTLAVSSSAAGEPQGVLLKGNLFAGVDPSECTWQMGALQLKTILRKYTWPIKFSLHQLKISA
jgi:hypothetical protein